MRKITTRRKTRTPGRRGRVSRIKGTSLGQIPTVTKTIWRADIPRAWDGVTRDSQVVSAVLICSGRSFATYQREQVQL